MINFLLVNISVLHYIFVYTKNNHKNNHISFKKEFLNNISYVFKLLILCYTNDSQTWYPGHVTSQ